ncbi:MAG: lipocalin-like domain-containing protein [Saprospiraceae bacterium]|nr:lipocalin-like domain-containing protein [Saprospiraceae bacterium]
MKNNELTVVGTWAMTEAWDIGDDPNDPNKKTYPWGNPSLGYWVYDKSGHFSLMISQNPALPIPEAFPGVASPEWLSPNEPWKVPYDLMLDSFGPKASPYAYFGTYVIKMDENDPNSGKIYHKVVSDVMRAYTNTVQERSFVFDGPDTINLGEPGVYLRKLQRLT